MVQHERDIFNDWSKYETDRHKIVSQRKHCLHNLDETDVERGLEVCGRRMRKTYSTIQTINTNVLCCE